ncbi:MAG TPA: hypothetical protein VF725_02395 [Ktedonobacterales bacterium]
MDKGGHTSTRDRILGVAVFLTEASKLNAVIHLAMRLRVPYITLRDELYPHPTFAEGLMASLARG